MRNPLAIVAIAILVMSTLSLLPNTHAATAVGGAITHDTVWTSKGSPYQFTGSLNIENGATLTIEPGVTVDLGTYFLQVKGALYAKGTAEKNIVFTSSNRWSTPYIQFTESSVDWNPETSQGSVVENAYFNHTTLTIISSSPKIAHNTFEESDNNALTAITISDSAAIISNNILHGLYAGITVNGDATITDNIINGTGYTVRAIEASGNAKIMHNYINGGYNTVSLSGQALFQENTVMGADYCAVTGSSNQVKIIRNYVTDNRYGITGSGTIESNTITANKVAIYGPSSTASIKNNNIFGNTENSVFLTDNSDANVKNNYWGTTDKQSIAQSIHDSHDDFTLGTANFESFLLFESSSAPSEPIVSDSSSTWLSTVGSSTTGSITIPVYSYQVFLFESYITIVVEVVFVVIVISWAIVLTVFLVKRKASKRH